MSKGFLFDYSQAHQLLFLLISVLLHSCLAEPKPRPKAKAQGLEYYGEYEEGDYSYGGDYYGSGQSRL